MSKKAIIISIAAAVIIASGVAAGLWFFRDVVNAPSQNTANFEPDRSADYGACQLLTKDQIKRALGNVANDLRNGFDSGRVFYSEGLESQYCSYDFAADAAAGNFKAEVIMKNTEAGIDEATQLLQRDELVTEVSVDNAPAFYRQFTDQLQLDSPKITHFTVTFFDGTTQYTLSVNLPEGSTAMTDDLAQEALASLATDLKQR